MPERANAISMLEDDHETLRDLLVALGQTTERASKMRKNLLRRLVACVHVHTALEEQLFYPVFLRAVARREDRQMYFDAVEEHHVVDMLMRELARTRITDEAFRAKARILRQIVERHVETEEADLFPRARRVLGAERLIALGDEMAQRKTQLMVLPR
jgi:hemerythrin-like domain-containing protein